ncbi:GntR family transcriptional regulator [Scopulibacillus cellulosilyticus]|uniref:GntR family transcriptional regulator n=1 Tax=Scopulibacillus cellulosilyticus TaxID=2665665 RepID=A0ABW2PYQ4_9BACL
MSFSFNSKIPLYYQIREDILHKIEQGHYNVGDQLPSELQLVEDYGVSRPTIRQAISELVQEGYLIRGRGRGTFVSQPMITDNALVFSSFEEESNIEYHWEKVVECNIINASSEIARDLNLTANDEVFEITVLKGIYQDCLTIRTSQIPVKLAPGLFEAENLKDLRLYKILRENYGLVPTNSKQSFQSVPAAQDESALLEVDLGSPLTLWRGVLYSNEVPMARVKTLFRGDRFRFEITQNEGAKDTAVMKLVNLSD